MNADEAKSGRQNYQGTTIRKTSNNCLKRNICKVTDINQSKQIKSMLLDLESRSKI